MLRMANSTVKRRLGVALVLSSLAAAGAAGQGCKSSDDAQAGCPDDLQYFQANVWEPILSQDCAVCHSADGLAKGSGMVFAPSSEEGYLKKNFEAARAVAEKKENGESLLLLKPTGRAKGGHVGGVKIQTGSADYQALSTFVGRVTEGKGCDVAPLSCGSTPPPGRRALRRLTRAEYDRTVHDLLGVDSTYGASFAADPVVNGFDNNADELRVSPLLAEQLRNAAEEIAADAVKAGTALPCNPQGAGGEAACAAQIVEKVGKRAFRRPLTDAEKARYLDLYTKIAGMDGFSAGATAVLTAMLQSPSFLYRMELGAPSGGAYKLSPYEIATELSYLIWGTMPDDALLAKAESGALSSPQEIASEAKRLLADPKSDAMTAQFMEEWLHLDRLSTVPKDAMTYPRFTADIRDAMHKETQRFVRAVVREGSGTLTELLTAKYSYMNDALAAFYGLPKPSGDADADGFRKVDLTGTGRLGLLTQGSVLSTYARPAESSPIHRGKFVREQLLCQPLPPPPPGLMVVPPPPKPGQTTRERFASHASVEPCLSCHTRIDPIGFGFEHFDGVGVYRQSEDGKPIDASGQILQSPHTDGEFNGTEELAEKLASSPDVSTCYTLQWLRFGYGSSDDAALSCMAGQLSEQLSAGHLDLTSLILALTASPRFTQRIGEGDEGTGGGPAPEPGGGAGGASMGSGSSTSAATSSSSTGGDQPNDPTLGVDVKVDSDWPTGACKSVTVTNHGTASATWSILLDPGGTLQNVWNAVAEPAGAKTRFSGTPSNATIAPNAAASFGFCINK